MVQPDNDDNVVIDDPKAWQAFAHPIRVRLLYELAAQDAARVADLAEAIDAPANSVSFHLRQLARFGFVEPDDLPGRDGREKWWRTTARRGFRMEGESLVRQEGGQHAAGVAMAVMREQALNKVEAWFAATSQEEASDALRSSNYDVRLRLTSQEREAFGEELNALLNKWADRGRAARAAGQSDTATDYEVWGFGMDKRSLEAARQREGG